ncbi:MAG: hypothetical protein WCW63_02480, partial [Acholeplasmataceae bacterium]
MTVIFQTYDEIIGRIQEPIRDTSKIFVVNVNTYSNYKLIFDTFTESKKIRLSDFTDGDNYPSKSECYEKIKGTDNTTLVCGFSQYMVLLPEKDQQRIFSDILQISLSSKLPHAVVFLFYRQESLLLNKLKGDLRLNENILLLNDKPSDKLSLITFVPPNLRFGDSEIILSGYKKYLYKSEDNPATSWTVRTDFALSP